MGLGRLHILFVPSWYPSEDAPLLGTFFREQAEMFVEAGHKAGVLHARFHDLPSKGWLNGPSHGVRITEENGLTVVRAAQRLRQPGPFQRIPMFYRASVRQRQKLALKMYDSYIEANGKPDIIHAKCTMWGAVLAHAIAQRENIPWITTVGASIFARGIAGPRECKTASVTLAAANRLLSVSNSLADDLERILGIPRESFTLMPNMIDVAKFPLTEPRDTGEEFHWGYMANMVADKGHDTLLHAFSTLSTGKLSLAGDGPHRARLELLCSKLEITDRVTFVGALPRGEVASFFQDIDGFVHPSRYETFGIVLVEALASGRPVVATRCGGPNDIVREQDGLLVEVDNPDDLAAAMQEVVSGEWDGVEMHAGIVERYSKAAIRDQLLAIYHTLL